MALVPCCRCYSPSPHFFPFCQCSPSQKKQELRARRLNLLKPVDYIDGSLRMANDGKFYFEDEFIAYYGEEWGKQQFARGVRILRSERDAYIQEYKDSTLLLACCMQKHANMDAGTLDLICEFWMHPYVLENKRAQAPKLWEPESEPDNDEGSLQSAEDGSQSYTDSAHMPADTHTMYTAQTQNQRGRQSRAKSSNQSLPMSERNILIGVAPGVILLTSLCHR